MLLISKQQECHSIPLFHYVHVPCLCGTHITAQYIELTNQKGDVRIGLIDSIIRLRSSVKVTDLGSIYSRSQQSRNPSRQQSPWIGSQIPGPGIDERYSEELWDRSNHQEDSIPRAAPSRAGDRDKVRNGIFGLDVNANSTR